MCLGWYAIIGLPGGAGFWSKDLLLERLFLGSGVEPVIGGLALAIALVTALYMSRLMYLVFWSPARHGDEAKPAIREGSFTMMLPLMVLGLGSLVVGMLWAPLLDPLFAPSGSAVVTMGGTVKTVDIGGGSVLTVFRDYLAPVVGEAQRHFLAQTDPDLLKAARHGPGVLLPLLGVLAAIAGILVARAFWRRGWPGRRDGSLEGFAASWSWCFDRVAHALVVLPLTWSAWVLAWVVDAAIGFMVHGLTDLVRFISDGYTSVQRPRLRSSLTLSLAGGAVLLAVLLLSWPFNLVVAVVAGLAVALILLLELLCR
jgi:NADH-quinone oxidoreductase subunit L